MCGRVVEAPYTRRLCPHYHHHSGVAGGACGADYGLYQHVPHDIQALSTPAAAAAAALARTLQMTKHVLGVVVLKQGLSDISSERGTQGDEEKCVGVKGVGPVTLMS